MRDIGEPLDRGQVDRGTDETRPLREALRLVALFTGVVLLNGVLAILFIAFMQALGLRGPASSEPVLLDEVHSGLRALVPRSSASTA